MVAPNGYGLLIAVQNLHGCWRTLLGWHDGLVMPSLHCDCPLAGYC